MPWLKVLFDTPITYTTFRYIQICIYFALLPCIVFDLGWGVGAFPPPPPCSNLTIHRKILKITSPANAKIIYERQGASIIKACAQPFINEFGVSTITQLTRTAVALASFCSTSTPSHFIQTSRFHLLFVEKWRSLPL